MITHMSFYDLSLILASYTFPRAFSQEILGIFLQAFGETTYSLMWNTTGMLKLSITALNTSVVVKYWHIELMPTVNPKCHSLTTQEPEHYKWLYRNCQCSCWRSCLLMQVTDLIFNFNNLYTIFATSWTNIIQYIIIHKCYWRFELENFSIKSALSVFHHCFSSSLQPLLDQLSSIDRGWELLLGYTFIGAG